FSYGCTPISCRMSIDCDDDVLTDLSTFKQIGFKQWVLFHQLGNDRPDTCSRDRHFFYPCNVAQVGEQLSSGHNFSRHKVITTRLSVRLLEDILFDIERS